MTRVRLESFGAIVALEEPPALVWIDHDMSRALGVQPADDLWTRDAGRLQGPTEVHVLTTERCPAGCPSCYVDATMKSPEPSTAELKHWLQRLADLQVFHVALGGGESMLRDDLFEVAAHARALGLVPNLTTSGIGMTAERARACRVFGQVNISFDGTGAIYRRSRGYDGEALALRALRMLADEGVSVGINIVLQRETFDALDATVEAAWEAGAREVELLRFKPTGRARDTWEACRLTEFQRDRVLETVLGLHHRYPGVHVKIDCSLVPFLCAAEPDPALLERFGVMGCEAGNMLAAVRADGRATACSFLEDAVGTVDDLADHWEDSPALARWHQYHRSAPEPCRSCPWRQVCKGGCRAVSRTVLGDAMLPDPECPRVIAHGLGDPTPVSPPPAS